MKIEHSLPVCVFLLVVRMVHSSPLRPTHCHFVYDAEKKGIYFTFFINIIFIIPCSFLSKKSWIFVFARRCA